MSENNITQEMTHRTRKLWEVLTPPVLIESQAQLELPLAPSNIKEMLEGLDAASIINSFKTELKGFIKELQQSSTNFQAMSFIWFYDGGDIPDNAEGMAYENCTPDYDFLMSDGSLEREHATFSGEELELGYLSINKVMAVWYEQEMKLFMGLDEDVFVQPKEEGEDDYELQDVYKELFMLKLMEFLRRAYLEIEGDKPTYFFIRTHDRWPLLIADGQH